jgi:hypothetical protein
MSTPEAKTRPGLPGNQQLDQQDLIQAVMREASALAGEGYQISVTSDETWVDLAVKQAGRPPAWYSWRISGGHTARDVKVGVEFAFEQSGRRKW